MNYKKYFKDLQKLRYKTSKAEMENPDQYDIYIDETAAHYMLDNKVSIDLEGLTIEINFDKEFKEPTYIDLCFYGKESSDSFIFKKTDFVSVKKGRKPIIKKYKVKS